MKFLRTILSLFTKPPKSNMTLMYSIIHDNYTSKVEKMNVNLIGVHLENDLDSTVENTKLTAHLIDVSDMHPLNLVDALIDSGEKTSIIYYLKIEEGIRRTEIVPKKNPTTTKYIYILNLGDFIRMLDSLRNQGDDKLDNYLSASIIISLDYTWNDIEKQLKENKFILTNV